MTWRSKGRNRLPSVWRHGVMARFFEVIEKEDVPDSYLVRKAGVAKGKLYEFRTGARAPNSLLAIEQILDVIGYELVIRRKRRSRYGDDDEAGDAPVPGRRVREGKPGPEQPVRPEAVQETGRA